MRTQTWSAWLLFSVFTSSLLPGCPASAHPRYSSYPYSIAVEDEYGNSLRTFDHGGERFVLGNYGKRYNIVVRNHSGQRVEAVVSVDGRDVVSGRVADFVRERGYVLEPYGTLRIEGFRKSFEQVAAFRFSTPSQSYSSRMGTPENVGVIGAAFFPERVRPAPRPLAAPAPAAEYRRREAAKSRTTTPRRSARAPAAAERTHDSDPRDSGGASARANNLGTEYGETRDSRVEEVAFVRASAQKPAVVTALRYDNAAGLRARGIEIEPRVSYREPDPFPRNRFAPPPP